MFKNPKITWTPKEIRGDVDINVEQKNIEVSPGQFVQVPVQPTDAIVNPDIRSNFPPEDLVIMDDMVNTLNQWEKDLNDLESDIDDKLKDMVIPYDPNKFPILDDALKCPTCGDPNSPDSITYEQYRKNKDRLNMAPSLTANIGSVEPAEIGNYSSQDLFSLMQQRISKFDFNILDLVWRQILIWVLEFLYGLVQPLESAPFGIDQIPKSIKRAIDGLKRKISVPADQVLRDSFRNDVNNPDATWNNQLESYYRNQDISDVSSLANIYDTADFIATTCLKKYKDIDDAVGIFVQGTRYENWLNLRQVNDAQKKLLTQAQQYAGMVVPDKFVSSTGIIFNNNLPQEYLKARGDAKGVKPSFLGGGWDIIKKNGQESIDKIKKVMQDWLLNTDTLCCILKNLLNVSQLTVSSNFDEGRKILLGIKTVLEMLRVSFSWDFKADLASLFNLIVDLVNSIVGQIIITYINLLKSESTKSINKLLPSDSLEGDKFCLPWKQLLQAVRDQVDKMLKDLFAYLDAFVENLKVSYVKSSEITKNIAFAFELDKYIYLIDKILDFMKVWEICVDGPRSTSGTPVDSRSVIAALEKDTNLPDNLKNDIIKSLQNGEKAPTTYSSGAIEGMQAKKPGSPLSDLIKKYDTQSQDTVLDRTTQTWQVSEPGMRILLTNFIGLSESESAAVLADTGDCGCDNALSDKELNAIRKSLLGETNG